MSPRTSYVLFGLLTLLVLGAPCCGDPCATSLAFHAPVPASHLAPGDTLTYELFETVWTVDVYCGGGVQSSSFPETLLLVENPRIASAWLESSSEETRHPSRLHVVARSAGRTTILLRAEAEVNCETMLDATHFTVTVSPSQSAPVRISS